MTRLSNEFPYISNFLDKTLDGLKAAYELRSKKLGDQKKILMDLSEETKPLSDEYLRAAQENIKKEALGPYDNEIDEINQNFINFKDISSTIYDNGNLNKISDNILLLKDASKIVFDIFNKAVRQVDSIKNKTPQVFIQKLAELETTANIEEYKQKERGGLKKPILSGINNIPKASYSGNAIKSLTLHHQNNTHSFKDFSKKILEEIRASINAINAIKTDNYSAHQKNILQEAGNKLGEAPVTITPAAQLVSENTNEQELGGPSSAPSLGSSFEEGLSWEKNINDSEPMLLKEENNQLKQELEEAEDVILSILNEKAEAEAEAEFLYENRGSQSKYIEDLKIKNKELHDKINTFYNQSDVYRNPLFATSETSNAETQADLTPKGSSNNVDITPPSTSESGSSSASSVIEQPSSFLSNELLSNLFNSNNNFRIKERIKINTENPNNVSEKWTSFALKKQESNIILFEFEAKIDRTTVMEELGINSKKYEISADNLKGYLMNDCEASSNKIIPKLFLKNKDGNIIDSVTSFSLKNKEKYRDITFSEKKFLSTNIFYTLEDAEKSKYCIKIRFNKNIYDSKIDTNTNIFIQKDVSSKRDGTEFKPINIENEPIEFKKVLKSLKDIKINLRIFSTKEDCKSFQDNPKVLELDFNYFYEAIRSFTKPSNTTRIDSYLPIKERSPENSK